MSEQVQKFDIGDVVRRKVREMFADIIPDDLLDQYLKQEMAGFFANEKKYDTRNPTEIAHSSPFAKLVREEVLAYLKETLPGRVRQAVEKMVSEIEVTDLVEMIAKAQARYEAEFKERMVANLYENIRLTAERIIMQMKSEGRL